MRKFKNSLAELLLYIVLLYAVYIAISQCGDLKGALMAMKSLTYVLLYVYLCNGLKNYIKAYPQNIGLRIIYHVVRLEFTRIMPSYWKPIIERCKEEMENKKDVKG